MRFPHLTKSSMGQPCDGVPCDVCRACNTCSAKLPGPHTDYICEKCSKVVGAFAATL